MNQLQARVAAFSCALIIATVVCGASQAVSALERPSVNAIALDKEPVLDGNVLDDPIWQPHEPVTEFKQHSPDNGADPTERTAVLIGFSEEALYVAIVCYEQDVNNIRTSNNGWESDSFALILDPFNTELDGLSFSTNPVGAQWEATIDGGGRDWNWSTKWTAKAQIIEQGWSAEMRIPFTSLRYGTREVQSWGVNFGRVRVRENEVDHWAELPRHQSITRLDRAGSLQGIRAPEQPKNLKFSPYGVASRSQDDWWGDERDSAVGFDVKYSLSPRMTMDFTYNTDFAQVESDNLQINLGRFSLFFPETRPFFLENAGMFSAGSIYQTLLFHSRTIGIASDGRRLPIDGGVRLTGRVAKSTNVGMLLMRADGSEPGSKSDFAVTRVRKNFANRTSAGFIAVNRDDGSSSNQAIATDFSLGIGDRVDYAFTIAKTRSNNIDEDDHAYAISGGYSSPNLSYFAYYGEIGAGFNPEAGYVPRRDTRTIYLDFRHTHLVENFFGMREWIHPIWYSRTHNFDGHLQSSNLHLESWFTLRNGGDFWVAADLNTEGVRRSFSIAGVPIPAGNYDAIEYTIALNSPSTKNYRISVSAVQGGFYSGNRFNANVGLNYTKDETFSAWIGYTHNNINLPTKDNAFNADLGSLGFKYSFTPKIDFNAQVQYNSADDVLATNARFAWLRTASAGLYIVYSNVESKGAGLGPNRTEIAVKYSHIFDVLR